MLPIAEVRAKIQQAIGLCKDLPMTVNCSGMVIFAVHQVWPKPCCKTQWKVDDKGRGGQQHQGMWIGLECGKSKMAVENRKEIGGNGLQIICGTPITPTINTDDDK